MAIGPGEVQGVSRLRDHFRRIADRGGQLEEVDKMTTTTGVLELFTKNQYASKVDLIAIYLRFNSLLIECL